MPGVTSTEMCQCLERQVKGRANVAKGGLDIYPMKYQSTCHPWQ